MEKEVVMDHKNVKITYSKKGNYIHETWWGMTPGPLFEEILDGIINILEDKRAHGIILDAREH